MTRVNIVPPSELHDQHLIAEYREIIMVPGSLNRTLRSKHGLVEEKISDTYTLNHGHVYFFYNKGLYLDKRYTELVSEMKSRGFHPNSNRKFPKSIFIDNGLYHDWTPSVKEQSIARERIQQKIKMKPNWYRKNVNGQKTYIR